MASVSKISLPSSLASSLLDSLFALVIASASTYLFPFLSSYPAPFPLPLSLFSGPLTQSFFLFHMPRPKRARREGERQERRARSSASWILCLSSPLMPRTFLLHPWRARWPSKYMVIAAVASHDDYCCATGIGGIGENKRRTA